MPDLTDSHILDPVSYSDAHYPVHAKATYFPTFVRVYVPSSPYMKLDPHFELMSESEQNTTSTSSTYTNEFNLERSLRRTRKTVKDLILSNDFELFATYTIRLDRQNVPRSKNKVGYWIKNQQARVGAFGYIFVPEFHKDHQSLHFHALLKGYNGHLKQSVNPFTGKPIIQGGKHVYEIPSFRSGFTNVKKIDLKNDTKTKVAFYLQKYITKDMPLFANKNRYWASHNLLRPITQDNPAEWYKHEKPDRTYTNEYGTILEFDFARHQIKNPLRGSRL